MSTETDRQSTTQIIPPADFSLPGEATAVIDVDKNGIMIPGHPLQEEERNLSIPGYRLLSVLGIGGMGTVYLAQQESLERLVAVKVIRKEFAKLNHSLKQMKEEGRIMAALSHPNVVACYDIVSTDDNLCLIMEYIPGHMTVRNLVARYGGLDESLVIRLLVDIVDGLMYVHDKGFIHRDLKPDNLLIFREKQDFFPTVSALFSQPGTRILIADFGIAHSIHEGGSDDTDHHVAGSPIYMAPEQYYYPETIDFRADIYSLACTAYYLLTGQPPFTGDNMETVLETKRTHGVPNPKELLPDIESDLCHIILRMGKPHPDDRYQSYEALMADLKRLLPMHDDSFQAAGRKQKNLAFVRGTLWTFAVMMLFFIGYLFYPTILSHLLRNHELSMAQSLGFWVKESTKAWNLLPPDSPKSLPYMRGICAENPLILDRTIVPGDTIEFQTRFFGGERMKFGFMVDEQPILWIHWYHLNGIRSELTLSTEDSSNSYIGEISQPSINDWVTFRLKITGTQVIISANNSIMGIANFKDSLSEIKFFLTMDSAHITEIKDFFVFKKQ